MSGYHVDNNPILERKRKGYVVSPVAVAIAVVSIVTVVVIVVAVCIRQHVQILTHAIPLILRRAAAAVINRTVDLRCNVQHTPSFIGTVVHVSAVSVRVFQVVGCILELIGKVLEIAVVVVVSVAAIAAAVVTVIVIVISVNGLFKALRTVLQILDRGFDVIVIAVTVIAAVVVAAITAAVPLCGSNRR